MLHIKLSLLDSSNLHIYNNLIQCYECEFSSITKKKPDQDGLFGVDTHIGGNVLGFIGFVDNTPASFAAIKMHASHKYEICEFCVVPFFRRHGIGTLFAESILKKFPGFWEIKQIEGADYAVSFWRSVLFDLTDNCFEEDVFMDSYWGRVTRQRFEILE